MRSERVRVSRDGLSRSASVATSRRSAASRTVAKPQLDRLLAVASLPRVSLGIIPQTAPRKTYAQVPFWIYDEPWWASRHPPRSWR
ncbi:Scr1 family TA system antitoxin-like transcriptional regulator [Actinophytocola sp.]|uniref:Scr1 family TA system antitoxin-like transcriptional regulator n=1 Tax=Actinophytocola sp. TaxID=1872138 RepID=UPI003C75116A